ncbi:DUF721 domain-containing protein [Caldichromatium japonicum]|uniref:DUF721 domain-containing protein n=1 Tax=Caldichromatium japonicum TaxID=2699430 RepID=A0A6G7VEJ3_9GAMM|nr:DciA family protein [Caldichromatium japonicum]QIK38372.1 DUF721 domain-containing protein [Caldichromatium japonicum]
MRELQHIGDYLHQSGPLQERLAREREAQRLSQAIRARLPPQIQGHYLDARLVNGRLTLYVDSTAWLTRARFLAQEILNSLTSYHVKAVEFQVRLIESPGLAKGQSGPRLSAVAARHLLKAAEQQSDPQLKETLRRLASRGLAQKVRD